MRRSSLNSGPCLLAALAPRRRPGAPRRVPPRRRPSARPAAPAPPVAGPRDEEKTLYAVGLSIWQSLKVFDLTPAEFEIVKRGMLEAAAGKPAPDVTLESDGPKIQPLVQARTQRRLEKEKARSDEYLAKTELEPGSVKSASGLIYREIVAGTGETPTLTDTVKVHYRGTLIDGTEFDSSLKRDGRRNSG